MLLLYHTYKVVYIYIHVCVCANLSGIGIIDLIYILLNEISLI